MKKCNLTHLEELEAESIHVLRETAAQFSSSTLLFSGGKDSLVCLHLIAKAFYPANAPFVALHVDTGHNFPEVMKFRDEVLEQYKTKLFERKVEDAIADGLIKDEIGIGATRNELQIPVLLDAIEHHKFDACLGGARRDDDDRAVGAGFGRAGHVSRAEGQGRTVGSGQHILVNVQRWYRKTRHRPGIGPWPRLDVDAVRAGLGPGAAD